MNLHDPENPIFGNPENMLEIIKHFTGNPHANLQIIRKLGSSYYNTTMLIEEKNDDDIDRMKSHCQQMGHTLATSLKSYVVHRLVAENIKYLNNVNREVQRELDISDAYNINIPREYQPSDFDRVMKNLYSLKM